jgi:hypothetical protein
MLVSLFQAVWECPVAIYSYFHEQMTLLTLSVLVPR